MASTSVDLMDRLLATIRVRAPGVSNQIIQLELFNTLQEFFNDSNAWRWESVIPLVAGLQTYPIFPPDGSDMVQVMGAVYKGSPMSQAPSQGSGGSVNLTGRIQGVYDNFTNETLFTPDVIVSPGNVFQYSIFFPQYITIDIPPSDDAAQSPIQLLLALRMDPQNLSLDPNDWPLEEWMFSTFHETWLDGMMGRLMSQINKPYSNPQLASYHMKRFRKFIGRAKQTGDVGYSYNPMRVRYPRGGFIR